MSKFMKKFNVQISGKLGKSQVTLEVPVTLSLMAAASNEAVEEATHRGIQDIEVMSITEVPVSQYVQMEIPFEDHSEEESYEEESESEAVYSSYVSAQANSDCDSGQPAPVSTNQQSGYKPYSAVTAEREAEESLPPTFTPKINNSYVPYKTKIVPIDSKYTKLNFS